MIRIQENMLIWNEPRRCLKSSVFIQVGLLVLLVNFSSLAIGIPLISHSSPTNQQKTTTYNSFVEVKAEVQNGLTNEANADPKKNKKEFLATKDGDGKASFNRQPVGSASSLPDSNLSRLEKARIPHLKLQSKSGNHQDAREKHANSYFHSYGNPGHTDEAVEVSIPREVPIDYHRFYEEWSGHRVQDLEIVVNAFRNRSIIWLAGDSSLDNKHWISDSGWVDPVNGYSQLMRKALRDVAFQMNFILQNSNSVTINTAVEATTLADRSKGLLPQDKIIQSSMQEGDILVVSVGGNDIALEPTLQTGLNLIALLRLTPRYLIKKYAARIPALRYFVRLFKDKIANYVEKLVEFKKPKIIVVCMIYFPDMKTTGSWADFTLGLIGYNKNPEKLQLIIRTLFELATKNIESVKGVPVVPVALYDVMDGTQTELYEERVEPSVEGGAKMAKLILDSIEEAHSF